MGKLGFDKIRKHPPAPNLALSATSKHILNTNLSDNNTLRRGELLGVGRPIWLKVQESESRLAWISEMVRKELVVRDICSYAKSISCQLRSEELRFKEKERKILMGLMELKLKDEKLNLKNLTMKKSFPKRFLEAQI